MTEKSIQCNKAPAKGSASMALIYNSCFQLIIDYLGQTDQISTRTMSKRLATSKVLYIRLKLIKVSNIVTLQHSGLDIDAISVINQTIKRPNGPCSNQYVFDWIKPQNRKSLVYLYENCIRHNYDFTGMTSYDTNQCIDLTELRGNLNISRMYRLVLPAELRVSTLLCDHCHLEELPRLPNLTGILDCSNNQLTELPDLPSLTGMLVCFRNKLTRLPKLSNLIGTLWCSVNRLPELPELPNLTDKLNCSDNLLKQLPKLPKLTQQLDCSKNRITELPELPNLTDSLDCSKNKLTELPELPNLTLSLDCSKNRLVKLPNLLNLVQSLDCSNNRLTRLPELPNLTESLWLYGNNIKILPKLNVFQIIIAQ